METLMKDLTEWKNNIWVVLSDPLFTVGKTDFSVVTVLSVVFAIVAIIWVSAKLRSVLVSRILKHYRVDEGVADATGTIFRYLFVTVGLAITVESVGIDLSSLQIVAGALGVGIGFGLQNITNNFISGMIILFERPIKVGDRIEVGNLEGNVVDISARATTVVTNDNVSVIVPNSDFITKQVINWSHNDRLARFRFAVSVSYNEDPALVKKALLEVVAENSGVLKHPEPDVLFDSFGDSSLDFMLRVWTKEYIDRPRVLKSQLYFAIFKKFAAYGIEIPYPQRDIHIRSEQTKEIIFKTLEKDIEVKKVFGGKEKPTEQKDIEKSQTDKPNMD